MCGIALSGCLNGEPALNEIPADYEETMSINLGDDITYTQYLIETQDSSQVLNDLKQIAENEGWEAIADWEGTFVGYEVGVALEKDDNVMIINTEVEDESTIATIITGPKEGADIAGMNDEVTTPPTDEGEYVPVDEPPTTDVDGQDFTDVPRYPNSVRINYLSVTVDSDTDKEQVDYLTDQELESIKEFYENELDVHGWEVVTAMIVTERDDAQLFIEANKDNEYLKLGTQPSSDYDDMTEIMIYVETRND